MSENYPENSIYRQLNNEMLQGLKNICQQAARVSEGTRYTDALFNEANDQLDEVVKTTESAAMNIMEIVEKQDTLAQESANLIRELGNGPDAAKLRRLEEINQDLRKDLVTLLTTLSFQDIAGQRIKKVVSALHSIEGSVLELYLASGLMLEAAERQPEKDAEALAAEARKAVENFRENRSAAGPALKGPDKNGASQAAIDDMLAQLGL